MRLSPSTFAASFAHPLTAALVLGASLGATACNSQISSGAGDHPEGPGSFVAGAADAHCGSKVQATSPAACQSDGSGGAGGAGSGSGGAVSAYGEPLFNGEGDDDECKYHVAIAPSDEIYAGEDVSFKLSIESKIDHSPVSEAGPYIEAFLNDTHPGPETTQTIYEGYPGTYTVGPVRFDDAGRWTIRLHIFDTCADLDAASPHGHVAFYVDL